MRIISPTCELKPPVKGAIQNIEEQVQNLTTHAEIRELRQYLKDEVAKVQNTVEEILHILLNKTRKGKCVTNGSISNPQNTSKPTYTSIQMEELDTNLNRSLSIQSKVYRFMSDTLIDCADLFEKGINASGVYKIDPDGLGSFNVFCDMATSGGGWTVFQRRLDGSVDFYRGWKDYKKGFGNLNGEFWLGLDKIHRLTAAVSLTALRFDMEDTSGNRRYAWYDSFAIGDEQQKYELSVGGYVGTAGDSFTHHRGAEFATKDAGNGRHCAQTHKGAWWYRDVKCFNNTGITRVQLEKNERGKLWAIASSENGEEGGPRSILQLAPLCKWSLFRFSAFGIKSFSNIKENNTTQLTIIHVLINILLTIGNIDIGRKLKIYIRVIVRVFSNLLQKNAVLALPFSWAHANQGR
ncbi:Hypothetical predicted protein, partial [Paramuricea clavata]